MIGKKTNINAKNSILNNNSKISSIFFNGKLFVCKIAYFKTNKKNLNFSNKYMNIRKIDKKENIIEVDCYSFYKKNNQLFEQTLKQHLNDYQKDVNEKNYLTGGNCVMLFGQKYDVNIINTIIKNNNYKIDENNKKVLIYINRFLTNLSDQEIIKRWINSFSIEFLTSRINFFLRKFNKYKFVKKINFKRTKTFNGMCIRKSNDEFNLTFDLNSIIANKDSIDALICHEIAHLDIFGHGSDFYELVEKYCPDYKNKISGLYKNDNWKEF